MPTSRKPQPSPASPSGRILIICAAALLLIGGWVWTRYRGTSATEPVRKFTAVTDSLTTGAVPDTISQAVAEAVPTLPPNLVAAPDVKARKPKITPPASPQPVLPTAAKQPVESVKPAEPVAKSTEPVTPTPVACDQLVMRSGDLLDVKVSEIGVREIRYKRCRWKDSPDYVVSKADVLSIHFANGDVERF